MPNAHPFCVPTYDIVGLNGLFCVAIQSPVRSFVYGWSQAVNRLQMGGILYARQADILGLGATIECVQL